MLIYKKIKKYVFINISLAVPMLRFDILLYPTRIHIRASLLIMYKSQNVAIFFRWKEYCLAILCMIIYNLVNIDLLLFFS